MIVLPILITLAMLIARAKMKNKIYCASTTDIDIFISLPLLAFALDDPMGYMYL